MIRRPAISTLTDTLFPYTTLFRSDYFCISVSGYPEGHPDKITVVAEGVDGLTESERTRYSVSVGERSEEHTSELQSLMRISYAVFCLKKNRTHNTYLALTSNLHIFLFYLSTMNTSKHYFQSN